MPKQLCSDGQSNPQFRFAASAHNFPADNRQPQSDMGAKDLVQCRPGALGLNTPGLIAFHHDQDAYRFDGFYDEHWISTEWAWNDIETEAVFEALCGDYNNRANGRAYLRRAVATERYRSTDAQCPDR